MKLRMYNMNALTVFISRMTSSLETAFTVFNVTAPIIKFTKDSTIVEYKILNVDGLKSISFDINNKDFGLWVIFTQDEGSKVTVKGLNDFDEKINKTKNNMMLMQLECIKHGVKDSIE